MAERKGGNTVVVVDGGGRGSALVEGYATSSNVDHLIAVPGNDLMKFNTAGKPIETHPSLKTVSVAEIVEIARSRTDRGEVLVDVAQDNAVEQGVADELRSLGIPVIGPNREAGRVEWDKGWFRDFGKRNGLPQPKYERFNDVEAGVNFLNQQPEDAAWYVKASGLAEGKGALSARDRGEALRRIEDLTKFKDAGKEYVIEQWLKNDDGSLGEEFSFFVGTDGSDQFVYLGASQDHKQVFDNDEGDMTGGMGCVATPLIITEDLRKRVEREIIKPTIDGFNNEGINYQGVMYMSCMMVTENGEQKLYVIEANSRWGDPEVETIVPGYSNLFDISMSIANASGLVLPETDGLTRVAVAGASRGYPGNYDAVKGQEIHGLDGVRAMKGVRLYGAGVSVDENGVHRAKGGRLFYAVGEGHDVDEAAQKAYDAMGTIFVDGDPAGGNNLHYRRDIGWRDKKRLLERD